MDAARTLGSLRVLHYAVYGFVAILFPKCYRLHMFLGMKHSIFEMQEVMFFLLGTCTFAEHFDLLVREIVLH